MIAGRSDGRRFIQNLCLGRKVDEAEQKKKEIEESHDEGTAVSV